VAGAPADQAGGLATLGRDGRAAWQQAVDYYAEGPSRHDAVFDDALAAITLALADLPDGAAPSSRPEVPPALASALERAAAPYRQAWWPAHDRANRARIEELSE
jgi:hypothetical protein